MSALSTLDPPLSLPTMKPLFNSRTKRKAAFVALLVWLFALGSGVANACLIQVAQSAAAETEHAISPAQVNAIPDHEDGLQASKSECLEVFEVDAQSSPKQQVIFDSTHPVLTPQLAGGAHTTFLPTFGSRATPA